MESKPIHQTLKEYGRGIAGGLLFSLPMLYTMELWQMGFLIDSLHLLLFVFVGILLLIVYNHYVGLSSDHSLFTCFVESLEEMGIGILLTVLILYVTGRILPNMSFSEITGKIVVESITVAIGISIGKSQLGGSKDAKEKEKETFQEEAVKQRQHYFIRSINLALCGSLVVAANIAPTEEIVRIAFETTPFKLLIIAAISIAMGAAILYYLNFKGSGQLEIHRKSFMEIAAGTVIMYALALLISAFMLWFFGRFESISLYGIIAQTIVLGFPAALGASAGRLLIQ